MTAEDSALENIDLEEVKSAQSLYEQIIVVLKDLPGHTQELDWGTAELQVCHTKPKRRTLETTISVDLYD
jgi:hypothetical protein